MPPKNDPEFDDSDDLPDSDDSSNGGSKISATEWRKRYIGQTGKVDTLMRQLKDLKDRNADLVDRAETAESKARIASSDLDTTKSTDATALKAEQERNVVLERKLAAQQATLDASAVIAKDYGPLLPHHMAGDLKVRTDFESDELYKSYLDRMSKSLAPSTSPADADSTDDETPSDEIEEPAGDLDGLGTNRTLTGLTGTDKRNFLNGVTPSGGARVRPATKEARTRAQIGDDLMKITKQSDPDEYARLWAELDKARD